MCMCNGKRSPENKMYCSDECFSKVKNNFSIEKFKAWLKVQYNNNERELSTAEWLSEQDYLKGKLAALYDVLSYLTQQEK